MKRLLLLAALSLCAGSALAAADTAAAAKAPAADPVLGTWQLNAAASKFKSGPAFKAQTRTYAESGDQITVTIKSTGADGKEGVTQTTYRLDGKDYPVSGNPDYDGLSGKQLNSHTASFQLKRAGKVVGKTTRAVSHDGKKLRANTNVTAADGARSVNTLVFDRQ